jgi:hypothetical protein
MRQAVVSLDPELFAEQGFQLDVFREAGVRDTEVVSCEGPRGVLRVHLEEPADTDRLEEMDAVEWCERVAGGDDEHVYLLSAGRDDEAATASEDGRLPRCEQVEVTDRGVTLTWTGPQDRLRSSTGCRLQPRGQAPGHSP